MVNDSYFRFDDDEKIKYTFARSSQQKLDKLEIHSPYIEWKITEKIVLILDTLGSIYLTSILVVQCLQIGLHYDDNEMV